MRQAGTRGTAPGSAGPPVPPVAGPARGARAARRPAARATPPHQRPRASAPSRAPLHPHRLGDAALVAPQAAAPAISAKRRLGAPPRGFLPRPPFPLQVVVCQGEKSLLAGRSLHVSLGNDLCACSHVPFSFWGQGCCPGSAQNKKGFSNYPSCFHRHASCHEHTLSHSHTLICFLT